MAILTKRVYSLEPAWNEEGDYPFHMIDQQDMLFNFDGELSKAEPLMHRWNTPDLLVHDRRLQADIYWCAGEGFLFSSAAKASLAPVGGDDVEWLPVSVIGLGDYYILHPLRKVWLGRAASVEINPVSRNITVVHQYDFLMDDLVGVNVFRVAQARGSAADQGGYCCHSVMILGDVELCFRTRALSGVTCKLRATIAS